MSSYEHLMGINMQRCTAIYKNAEQIKSYIMVMWDTLQEEKKFPRWHILSLISQFFSFSKCDSQQSLNQFTEYNSASPDINKITDGILFIVESVLHDSQFITLTPKHSCQRWLKLSVPLLNSPDYHKDLQHQLVRLFYKIDLMIKNLLQDEKKL